VSIAHPSPLAGDADRAGAILKATLTRMSKGQSSGSMFALLASLPSTVLDDDARQAIVDGAQTSESLADPERTCIIRQALTHLIRGSSTKVYLCPVRLR